VLILVAAVAIAYIANCASPAYYWQATSGHLALMSARQPVDQAIESADTEQDVIEKLRLSKEIRAFAVEDLELPDNDSYTQFVQTGRDAVVWNVVAAPEFSLEAKTWCFPVAGCVPYRGYFDPSAAEHYAQKLDRRGLDVSVSPAVAYSTLGWFDDPLLDTMWRQSDAQFAAYIFHELAHQALYVEDDTAFNESYASFVERIGVERWLKGRGESGSLEKWKALNQASEAFSALLARTREELEAIYRSDVDTPEMRKEKEAAFEQMESNYRELRDREWQGRDYYGQWFERPPNNARFALLASYEGGACAFANLYAEAGGQMSHFQELARVRSELPAEQRKEWLDQKCRDIASGGEL